MNDFSKRFDLCMNSQRTLRDAMEPKCRCCFPCVVIHSLAPLLRCSCIFYCPSCVGVGRTATIMAAGALAGKVNGFVICEGSELARIPDELPKMLSRRVTLSSRLELVCFCNHSVRWWTVAWSLLFVSLRAAVQSKLREVELDRAHASVVLGSRRLAA
jgi:hypothetical protein